MRQDILSFKNIFNVLVFLFCAMNSWAQYEFKKITLTSNLDTQKLEVLTSEINRYMKENRDSFHLLMKRLKQQSDYQNFLPGIVLYNDKMAEDYFIVNNYDSCIWFAQQNVQLMDSLQYGHSYIVHSYYLIAMAYSNKKEYGQAYNYFLKSYKKADKYPQAYSLRDKILLLNNVISLWLKTQSLDEIKEYVNILEELVRNNRDNDTVKGLGNLALGAVYQLMGNDSFFSYYKQGINHIKDDSIDKYYLLRVLNFMAGYYIQKNNQDSLLFYLELFEKKKAFTNNEEPYLHFVEHKAHYHFLKKNYKQAIAIIQPLYDSSKIAGNVGFVLHILPLMIKIYDSAGLMKTAYKYSIEYGELSTSVYGKELSKMYAYQYKDQMKLLKDDLEEKDMHIFLQQKTLQQRTIIIFITVLSLLILGSLVYVLKRNLRLKEKVKKEEFERLNTQHELEKLASRITGIEDERKRLAIDLHDGVANELWALQLQLNHFTDKITQNAYDKKLLQQYQGHLSNVIEDVRNTAKNLRPSLLTQNGLESAVWQLCHRINSHQQKINVTCNIYETIPRFDKDTELSVYRIIQELTQNALKHASNATALDIQIIYKNQNLNVTIEDNGKGMPEDATSLNKNNGLANIYDRVKLLSGEISCLSYPDIGTCFIINIPNIS